MSKQCRPEGEQPFEIIYNIFDIRVVCKVTEMQESAVLLYIIWGCKNKELCVAPLTKNRVFYYLDNDSSAKDTILHKIIDDCIQW